MDNARIVRGFQRLADLACDIQSLVQPNGALANPLRKGWPSHQLHDQVIRTHVEQCADMRMTQRRDHARFAFKTIAEGLPGDLDRHLAAEPGIPGAIYLAHTPAADRR